MYCSFCKNEIPKGRGLTLAVKSGESTSFCSRRCRRYREMGKKSAKLKWTVKVIGAKKETKKPEGKK